MNTSSAMTANLRTPTSSCGYQPAQCPPFLVDYRVELRDFYPQLYAFLVDNIIVHMGTGKYLIADYPDVKAIEEPAIVSITATPKRRAAVPRTPASPSAIKLSAEQNAIYEQSPAAVRQFDAVLAALTSQCMTSVAARNALFRACGTSGRAMILHLEERGKGAIGTPLHMLSLHRLNTRQAEGIEPPITSATWAAYADELEHFTAGAGGIPEGTMANHLRMALYAIQDPTLLASLVTAASSVAKPIDIISAVAAAIDTHTLTQQLAAQMRGPNMALGGAHALMATTATLETAQPVLYGQRQHRPDPAKHSDMPETSYHRHTTPGRNPAERRTYLWVAAEHPPCLNWIRGRDGCDGRHHLPQCPLPRLAGAVTIEDMEDVTPPPTPALTTVTAPTAAAPAAAADFSELFGTGTRTIFLPAHDINTVLFATAVTPDETATPDTIPALPERPGRMTYAEMRRWLDAAVPFPPMPSLE